jgi:hypothetical protein
MWTVGRSPFHLDSERKNHMSKHNGRILALSVSALLIGLAACDSGPAAVEDDLLTRVQQETARFQSTQAATAAGYEPHGPCVANPELGGMGFHWIKQELVDPEFDPMQPEALLYAPNPDGSLRLVGVEYIVINTGQPRPEFDGHPFDIGGVGPLMAAGVPHWSLHVWIHEPNPRGVFSTYNPTVSCG